MTLDHVGIAVKDLEEARQTYIKLGFEVGPIEELPERKLRIAMVRLGESNLELLCPTDPDSPVGKFLAKNGPGIQHLCYRVENIDKKIEELRAAGVRLIDEKARPGAHGTRVAFVHPASVGGVLTEFCEHPRP